MEIKSIFVWAMDDNKNVQVIIGITWTLSMGLTWASEQIQVTYLQCIYCFQGQKEMEP